jgi:hypothetical protein
LAFGAIVGSVRPLRISENMFNGLAFLHNAVPWGLIVDADLSADLF